MTPARFDRMVATLLDSAVETERPEVDRAASEADRDAVVAARIDEHTAPIAEPPARVAQSPSARLDLMPRNLEITSLELAHLRTLGPLVSSPRAAKRLTNLYRIVRAGLDGDALDEFVADRFQLTQIVLAAVVGCPDLAAAWFKAILTRATGDATALLDALDSQAARHPRAKILCDRIRACPEHTSWEHVIAVCTMAARYSFETGGLLELRPA